MSEEMTRPPLSIAVGETTNWLSTWEDFSGADGWAVSLFLRGPAEVDLAGAVEGEGFRFAVAEDTFDTVGRYVWEAIATRPGERCRLGRGRITIESDLQAASGLGDQSTHAERMLAILEAALEGTATAAQLAYTIAGRSIDRIPLEDLRRLRDYYARKVRVEENLRAAGVERSPRTVAVQFR